MIRSYVICIGMHVGKTYFCTYFIQTEAERRRREAGVIQSMENGPESCIFLFMYNVTGKVGNQAFPGMPRQSENWAHIILHDCTC